MSKEGAKRQEWMLTAPPLRKQQKKETTLPVEGLSFPCGNQQQSKPDFASPLIDNGKAWNRSKILNVYAKAKETKTAINDCALACFATIEEFIKLEIEIFGKSLAVSPARNSKPPTAEMKETLLPAVSSSNKIAKRLEASMRQHKDCWFCASCEPEGDGLLISKAANTLLIFSKYDNLAAGECLIVPIEHVQSTLEASRDTQEEIRVFFVHLFLEF